MSNSRIIRLEEADSTNTYLKKLALDGAAEGTAVLALRQTAGRGTKERSFASPAGGLYLSYLIRPDTSPEETTEMTRRAAVAARRAVIRISGLAPDIKYVNDLLLHGRKLCGILTELNSGNLIIGIGLNLNTKPADLPEELRETAVSLYEETGRLYSVSDAAEVFIEELDRMAAAWPRHREEWLGEYEKHLIRG